jgi:hypothetical protein
VDPNRRATGALIRLGERLDDVLMVHASLWKIGPTNAKTNP